jgi:hypothetical protein
MADSLDFRAREEAGREGPHRIGVAGELRRGPMPNMSLSPQDVRSVIEFLDGETRRLAEAAKVAARKPAPSSHGDHNNHTGMAPKA